MFKGYVSLAKPTLTAAVSAESKTSKEEVVYPDFKYELEQGLSMEALRSCPWLVLNHPSYNGVFLSVPSLSGSSGAASKLLGKGGARGKSGRGAVGKGKKKVDTRTITKQFSLSDPMPKIGIPSDILNRSYMIVGQSNISAVLTTSVAVETFYQSNFNLTAYVNQQASLIAVFDQYRVIKVEYWITPRSAVEAISAAATNFGRMVACIDIDDAGVLASVAAATDYATAMVMPGGSCFFQQFVPHVAVAMYAGGVFTSFGNEKAPWIDAASPAVEHYGMKIAHTATTQVVIYDLALRYTVEFRNSR